MTLPALRTQDSDLADFSSHTFGFKLTWKANPRHTLDFGFDFVRRSDGLDHLLASLGWIWNF